MTGPQVLPAPRSTYQLLLDAATAWRDHIATQWIPDPGKRTRCLSWTCAELAGTVTRIANGLASLGVQRQDAVTLCGPSTSMLFAATLAAEHENGRLVVTVTGAGSGGVLAALAGFTLTVRTSPEAAARHRRRPAGK